MTLDCDWPWLIRYECSNHAASFIVLISICHRKFSLKRLEQWNFRSDENFQGTRVVEEEKRQATRGFYCNVAYRSLASPNKTKCLAFTRSSLKAFAFTGNARIYRITKLSKQERREVSVGSVVRYFQIFKNRRDILSLSSMFGRLVSLIVTKKQKDERWKTKIRYRWLDRRSSNKFNRAVLSTVCRAVSRNWRIKFYWNISNVSLLIYRVTLTRFLLLPPDVPNLLDS